MKIVTVGAPSELFEKVIELGNKNSATLGFLPRGAIEQKAREKKLLAAIEVDQVLGYLLFDFNLRARIAYIIHLCVSKECRGRGIAKSLFHKLEATVGDKVVGIRVHCRTDYEEADVWEKLGFTKYGTKPGRSKEGSELGVWCKDTPLPNLFDPAIESQESKLRVALDHNVLADSLKQRSDSTTGSHAIREDWLAEVIDFYVTPEVFTDIGRDEKPERRAMTKRLAEFFTRIKGSLRSLDESREKLRGLLTDDMSEQNKSDIEHIAWCCCSSMDFFVTNDGKLRSKSDDVYERTGVRILHPSDLVLRTHELLRSTAYQPKRFGETEIRIRRVKEEDLSAIEASIAVVAQEGKRTFMRELRAQLAQPEKRISNLVYRGLAILAVISWEVIDEEKLQVHIMRLAPGESMRTAALGIINWIISSCLTQGVDCLEIHDQHMGSEFGVACYEFGMQPVGRNWTRWIQCGRYSLERIHAMVDSPTTRRLLATEYRKVLCDRLDRISGAEDVSLLLQLEKDLWPVKIESLKMHTYIVSIRPQYAMHLFDRGLSAGDLFGGDPRLLFNVENAYYRSARGKRLSAPARILWYVSRGDGRYPDSQAIRAASYLDEVHLGDPKTLFNRFQHLGVYRWEDVKETATMRGSGDLMAFVFSRTEVFESPISRNDLDNIWLREMGSHFYVQQPIEIPDNLFWKIYNLGIGVPDEKAETE